MNDIKPTEFKPNELCIALAQNKETFRDFRIYLITLFNGDKEMVKKLEQARVEIIIPYLLSYLESKNIEIMEALLYYQHELLNVNFFTLLRATIINTFRKIEEGEPYFLPF